MTFKSLTLASLVVPWIAAQAIGRDGNLTVSFLADNQEATCEQDPSNGLIITTSTIPVSFTCFNVSDLFTQDNATGFQNASQTYYHSDSGAIVEPNGVHWLIENQDDFSSEANYSHIWYNQVDVTMQKPKLGGSWVLYVYAFDDCMQKEPGRDIDSDEFPWFETSCHTESGGQCQTVPNSIRSFGIGPGEEYNEAKEKCYSWAYQGYSGAEAILGYHVIRLVVGVASLTAMILIL